MRVFKMSYLPDSASLEALRAGRSGFIGQLPVGTSSLPANSVGTAQLQDGSVTSAKILDGTIVAADLAATGVGAGTYGSSLLIPTITVNAQGQVTAGSGVALVTPINASWFTFTTPGSPSGSGGAVTWGASSTGGGANITFAATTDIIVTGVGLDTARRWIVNANLYIASTATTPIQGDLQLSVNGGAYASVARQYQDPVPLGLAVSGFMFTYVQLAAVGSTYSFRIVLTSGDASNIAITASASNRFDVQPMF